MLKVVLMTAQPIQQIKVTNKPNNVYRNRIKDAVVHARRTCMTGSKISCLRAIDSILDSVDNTEPIIINENLNAINENISAINENISAINENIEQLAPFLRVKGFN